jgi:hypothetical protein
MKNLSIYIYNNSSIGSNEYKVIYNIIDELKNSNHFLTLKYNTKDNINFYNSIIFLIKSDYFIIHSPLIKSFFYAFLALFFNKKIIIFLWDIYPVMIGKERYDHSVRRYFLDLFENLLLSKSCLQIVPSQDFLSDKFENRIFIPFWYRPKFSSSRKPLNKQIKIVFAGQINLTRGFYDALNKLDSILEHQVILHIYSPSFFDILLCNNLKNIKLTYMGFFDSEIIAEKLSGYDFGLVTLNLGFINPAFPSKTFDYLAAGLPILYHGPPLKSYIDNLKVHNLILDISEINRLNLYSIKYFPLDFCSAREFFFKSICFKSHNFLHELTNIIDK